MTYHEIADMRKTIEAQWNSTSNPWNVTEFEHGIMVETALAFLNEVERLNGLLAGRTTDGPATPEPEPSTPSTSEPADTDKPPLTIDVQALACRIRSLVDEIIQMNAKGDPADPVAALIQLSGWVIGYSEAKAECETEVGR